MLNFYVYILRCNDGSYYTGHTDDLEKRIAQHHAGVVKCYTSLRLPVELVFAQEFPSRGDALAAERQIKNWSRKKKAALIREDADSLTLYAKKRFY